MSIRIQLEGFDKMLADIEKAGGTIDGAAKMCLLKSADIMQDELKKQMQQSNVDNGLINRMPPPEIEGNGNRVTARVGYKKGEYDPQNPSDGYKVVFANYGTPHRTEHGKQPAKGFIQRAKKKASPRIKRAQAETLQKIFEGLSN